MFFLEWATVTARTFNNKKKKVGPLVVQYETDTCILQFCSCKLYSKGVFFWQEECCVMRGSLGPKICGSPVLILSGWLLVLKLVLIRWFVWFFWCLLVLLVPVSLSNPRISTINGSIFSWFSGSSFFLYSGFSLSLSLGSSSPRQIGFSQRFLSLSAILQFWFSSFGSRRVLWFQFPFFFNSLDRSQRFLSLSLCDSSVLVLQFLVLVEFSGSSFLFKSLDRSQRFLSLSAILQFWFSRFVLQFHFQFLFHSFNSFCDPKKKSSPPCAGLCFCM